MRLARLSCAERPVSGDSYRRPWTRASPQSPLPHHPRDHDLHDAAHRTRLLDDERHDLIRDNTRRLYMALTRAGQRVVLTYVGEPPAAMLQSLEAQAA